jgi:hypothetical protein
MNDQHADRDHPKDDEHPDTACPRRGTDKDCDKQQRLQQATPPGAMFFEPPKVEMAEHEHCGGDRDIKPVGVSLPHADEPQEESGGWLNA